MLPRGNILDVRVVVSETDIAHWNPWCMLRDDVWFPLEKMTRNSWDKPVQRCQQQNHSVRFQKSLRDRWEPMRASLVKHPSGFTLFLYRKMGIHSPRHMWKTTSSTHVTCKVGTIDPIKNDVGQKMIFINQDTYDTDIHPLCSRSSTLDSSEEESWRCQKGPREMVLRPPMTWGWHGKMEMMIF